MKDHYDFSQGTRGRIVPERPLEPGKVKITLQIDGDIYDRFGRMADQFEGSVRYDTLINSALREYLDGKVPTFEDTLRRIIREELKGAA